MSSASMNIKKWKLYPKYKDSGVKWLDKVPVINWKIKKLSYIASSELNSFVDGPFGSDLKNQEYKDSGVPLIQLNNIRDGKHIIDDLKFVSEQKADDLERHIILPGQIVIAKMADPVARAAVVNSMYPRYLIVADCVKFAPNAENNFVPFIVYAINSPYIRYQAELLSTGTTRIRINLGQIKKLLILLPSLSEQRAIAAFLNRETAKIDDLVSKKQRLIELLQEKRAALISHAVTKGLDPNVPMKDSGVEWIGEIPMHWQVLKFSREVYIAKGQIDPEVDTYSSMLLIAPNHIESCTGQLLLKQTAEEQGAQSGKYMCRAGEVIYSKIRPALAKVTIAPSDCICSADMYPLNGDHRFINPYLFWLFLSNQFTAWSILEADRVAMPKINRETLNKLKMPNPPLPEQHAIADYLDNDTSMINKMITKVETTIERLQEYRTALISAAVTGKIDVRQEVA